MKESLISSLRGLGFAITAVTQTHIQADLHSFNNGGFNISIDLRDSTFTVELIHQFATTHLFLIQKFKDADHIVELLSGSYPFHEWILENDGTVEKMFKEYAILNGL